MNFTYEKIDGINSNAVSYLLLFLSKIKINTSKSQITLNQIKNL